MSNKLIENFARNVIDNQGIKMLSKNATKPIARTIRKYLILYTHIENYNIFIFTFISLILLKIPSFI